MPIFNDIVALLRAPVGNNLENHPDDIRVAKQLFAAEGRYKRPVDENKYIDQDLIDSMEGFQRDHNLKVDRRMNPGGETEAMLISKRLKLPQIEPPEEDRKVGYQQANAVPIFGALAMGLGMTATGAAQWWANQSADEREKIARSLDFTLNSGSDDKDPQQYCDEILEENLQRCKQVRRDHGPVTARICIETARTRHSQCRAGKPESDWRDLHTYD